MGWEPAQAANFKKMATRMVDSRWLRSFHSVQELRGSYEVKWTSKGFQRATLLQQVIVDFRLDDGSVVGFTRQSLTDSGERSRSAADASRAYWVACLEELRIECQEELLASLVRIVGCIDENTRTSFTAMLDLASKDGMVSIDDGL